MIDEEDNEQDLFIKLPMDIDPSRIKIFAEKEKGKFIITVNVAGPFTKDEENTIDGLCEAIEESHGEDLDYLRSLN